MRIIRKRNSYLIEISKQFLWFKWRSVLTYKINEPSFADDHTEYIERRYPYEFPSYTDAEKFINHMSRLPTLIGSPL